jgi:hypothetical protein
MTSTIERRLARLEQASAPPCSDWIEREWSDEAKALMRETLAGLTAPEEIEAVVSRGYVGPPIHLSPAAKAQMAQVLAELRACTP